MECRKGSWIIRVDVLCLDKTGTLTANRLDLHAVRPYGIAEAARARRSGTTMPPA